MLDVSRRGRGPRAPARDWTEIRARPAGPPEEAELPAADLSFLSDLSDDGTQVLGTDIGEGGGPNFAFYVQKTDGSAPVWLGEGDGQALSPDGRFVLAVLLVHATPQQLVVVPTGAGETRTLEPGPSCAIRARSGTLPGDASSSRDPTRRTRSASTCRTSPEVRRRR